MTVRYDDYANNYYTYGWVDEGFPATGEIEVGDDADWFGVWMEEGIEYTFDLEGSATGMGSLRDPLLRLMDGDGNLITSNDDGGEGLNSRITFTPDYNGVFYLSAESYWNNTGTYTLSMEASDDYADNTSTSGWVNESFSATGEIEAGDDADWFGVWMEEGIEYTFDLEGSATGMGSLRDPYLRLMDGDGNFITSNDDGGEGLNSQITFTPDYDGVFYLSAESFGSNTGTYTLSMEANDDYAGNTSTHGWVDTYFSATGEIEAGDDADWFEVWMDEGIEYTFDLEGSATGMGSLRDPYLRLMDGDGNLITSNDDGGEGLNSQITFTPDYDGVFYLSAESFGSNTGTYTLSMEAEASDDYAGNTSTHGWVDTYFSATGEIEAGDDADWFEVWMEAGNEYMFDLEGSATGMGSLRDPYLRLMDGDGNLITWNDDGGVGLNSQITFTPDYDGFFYLSAESFGSNTGTYTLSMTNLSDDWGWWM